MTNPGECQNQTEEEKKAYEDPVTLAYGGARVLITGADDAAGTITFIAPSRDGSSESYTEKWGQEGIMWAPCPSSLPSKAVPGDSGPLPEKGSYGTLYFSESYLTQHRDIQSGTPKWPPRLGPALTTTGVFANTIKVWPTRIAVTGIQLVNGKFTHGTVDMLDPALAVPGQTIAADGGTLDLELVPDGAFAFGVIFSPFPLLGAAVETIKAARPNPRDMALAWTVVDQCVRRLGEEADGDAATHVECLRQVLPDFSREPVD